MDEVLRELSFCYMYIDNILIASNSHGCRTTGSSLMCLFGVPELDFLGHHVDATGVRTLEMNVQAIKEFPRPATQRKLREFIGLVNFYRRFIPHPLAP
jgi:hypothetical protein